MADGGEESFEKRRRLDDDGSAEVRVTFTEMVEMTGGEEGGGSGGWIDAAVDGMEDDDGDDEFAEGNGAAARIRTAAEEGDATQLAAALRENPGVDVNTPGEDGDTALHLASLYGHEECVRILLEANSGVFEQDEDGAIPLHDAAAGGYSGIVRLLLAAAGSDDSRRRLVNCADGDGDTPLHNAARGEHLEVATLLLEAGASRDALNKDGDAPFSLVESRTDLRNLLKPVENRV